MFFKKILFSKWKTTEKLKGNEEEKEEMKEEARKAKDDERKAAEHVRKSTKRNQMNKIEFKAN